MSPSRRRKHARSPENVDDVIVRLTARRLIRGGPDRPAADIAQVDELPVRIARGVVGATASPSGRATPAPSAGIRHRRDVVAVREELRMGSTCAAER